jgi:hypothetical protein
MNDEARWLALFYDVKYFLEIRSSSDCFELAKSELSTNLSSHISFNISQQLVILVFA